MTNNRDKTPPSRSLLSAYMGTFFNPTTEQVSIQPLVARQLRAAGLIRNDPDYRYKWSLWDDEWNDLVHWGCEKLTVAQVCFRWMSRIGPSHKGDVWLVGPTGTGKDHMATILAVCLAIRWEWTALRCDWVVVTEELKPNNGADTTLEPFKECDVLIVSDVDRPDYTLFLSKKLGELIRTRIERNLVTIWTSNVPLETFCQQIRISCRRDEQRGYNGVGTKHAGKMEGAAQTIRSRLFGRVEGEVPFKSSKGDWREIHHEC